MSGPTSMDDVMAQAWRDNAAAEAGAPHSSEPPSTNPAGATATGTAPATPAADYADAWNRHSPLDDRPSLDNASSNWNDVKKKHPVAALIMSSMPFVGEVTSSAEMNDAVNRHDKMGMAKAAVGMIPAVSLLTGGAKAIRAGKVAADTAQIASGAAKAATGAGALATEGASNLDDFAHAWHTHK